MSFPERRKYPRIRLITKVAHIHGDRFHYFCSRDLSIGGIFLDTEHPYPLGTKLELELSLPDIADKIKILGEVVRIEPPEARQEGKSPGMGIQFYDMDNDTKAMLADFIGRELAKQ